MGKKLLERASSFLSFILYNAVLYKDIQPWESRNNTCKNNRVFFFSCLISPISCFQVDEDEGLLSELVRIKRIKHWKIRIAYRQWHSNFPRRGRKRKTGNYVFSGFGNGISRGWEQKSTTEIFATGRFWPCTWNIFFVGKDQFNNWQFCILKIRLIVCFCRDSMHVVILSAPTHYLIFMWGLSILLFSSIMESTFLVSKGLLSLYDKENNAWLLVDAYFSSRVQLDISLAHCEMSKAGQNYSMLIGWDRGHCFLITRAL